MFVCSQGGAAGAWAGGSVFATRPTLAVLHMISCPVSSAFRLFLHTQVCPALSALVVIMYSPAGVSISVSESDARGFSSSDQSIRPPFAEEQSHLVCRLTSTFSSLRPRTRRTGPRVVLGFVGQVVIGMDVDSMIILYTYEVAFFPPLVCEVSPNQPVLVLLLVSCQDCSVCAMHTGPPQHAQFRFFFFLRRETCTEVDNPARMRMHASCSHIVPFVDRVLTAVWHPHSSSYNSSDSFFFSDPIVPAHATSTIPLVEA